MTTRKAEIIARILELMETLKLAGKVRAVARRRTILALEQVRPAIHLVVGPEATSDADEDNRGYAVTFPLDLKLMVSEARDTESVLDDLTGEVQSAIESDLQLNQLAVRISYDGDQPFVQEETKPDGGTILQYTVQYRRERGAPQTGY